MSATSSAVDDDGHSGSAPDSFERTQIREQIEVYFNERAKATNFGPNVVAEIPRLAARVELALWRRAKDVTEYSNRFTLVDRIKGVSAELSKKTNSTSPRAAAPVAAKSPPYGAVTPPISGQYRSLRKSTSPPRKSHTFNGVNGMSKKSVREYVRRRKSSLSSGDETWDLAKSASGVGNSSSTSTNAQQQTQQQQIAAASQRRRSLDNMTEDSQKRRWCGDGHGVLLGGEDVSSRKTVEIPTRRRSSGTDHSDGGSTAVTASPRALTSPREMLKEPPPPPSAEASGSTIP